MRGPTPGPPAPVPSNVSVVIPTLDGAEHLGESLESVLGQTHQPLEVIVVVDGPGMETDLVAEPFGDRVRVIHPGGPVAGPAAARNRGIREARGELIAFNDADDVWLPHKLERQVARFAAKPDLACSVTRIELFWEKGVGWEEAAARKVGRAEAVPGFTTMTMVVPRSIFERVGMLDEHRWHSDAVEWLVRVDEAGLETEMIDDVLVRHRRRPGSLSRDEERGSNEFLSLVRERLQRQGEMGDS